MQTSTRFGIYLLAGVLSLGLISHFFNPEQEKTHYLETSILGVLENIAAEHRAAPADLMITSVDIKKTEGPKKYFNFYKYAAKVKILNQGGALKNARLQLSAGGQKIMKVGPVNIAAGESIVIDDYQLLISGEFNIAELVFDVQLEKKEEADINNNTYHAEIFESKAGLDLDPSNLLSGNYDPDLEIWYRESLPARFAQYRETLVDGAVIPYDLVENSRTILEDSAWKKLKEYDGRAGYFYLQKNNDDLIAVTDIWHLQPVEELSRAQFAKLFVEESAIKLQAEGLQLYEDVDYEQWYAPYVQTLYNLGLLDPGKTVYFPADTITRGEVLKTVLDYFKADLIVKLDEKPYFADIDETDLLYPYITALYRDGHGDVLSELFKPGSPATKDFLTYLVDAYRENN